MTEEVKQHLQTSFSVNFHHISWYTPFAHTAVFQLLHHYRTLALTVSEGWKCSPYITCHNKKFSTWQSFHHHYQCTYTYPLNSTIMWLLHHLLRVTSITVSNFYHNIKGFLTKNYSRGNLTYWICFVHKLLLGDNEEYTDSTYRCTVKIVTIDEEMFQPNIQDH